MTEPQLSDDSRQQIQYECEHQELMGVCHSLLAIVGQKPYALKLLKFVRQALLLHLNYKSNRQQ